jgi:CRP-like cAMP-binding protein
MTRIDNTDNIDFKNLIEKYPDLWEKKKMKKREFLIKQNEIEKNIFYVKSGILRCYFYDKEVGKEATIAFFSNDDVVIPYNSFFENLPTLMNIQVIKNAEIFIISKKNWKIIKKQESKLNKLLLKAAIQHLHKSSAYIVNNTIHSIIERYDYMLKKYPYLKELTDDEIALYIGVSRETLNRAKADQFKK